MIAAFMKCSYHKRMPTHAKNLPQVILSTCKLCQILKNQKRRIRDVSDLINQKKPVRVMSVTFQNF